MDLEKMISDKFPKKTALTQVIKDGNYIKITWVAHWRAWCSYNSLFSGQTCERLEERGGFGKEELDAFYPEWPNHVVS